MDGMKFVVENKKTCDSLHENFIKDAKAEKYYLNSEKLFCTEEDVFDSFTVEERDSLFGKPPSTVYENLSNLVNNEKTKILTKDNIFNDTLIASYKESMQEQWKNEIRFRLKESVLQTVRHFKKLHTTEDVTDLDIVNWEKVNTLRHELAKDSMSNQSLLTKIITALDSKDLESASNYQILIDNKLQELHELYNQYKDNLIN
jgi:glutamine synthetase